MHILARCNGGTFQFLFNYLLCLSVLCSALSVSRILVIISKTMTKNSDQHERSMTKNHDQYEGSKTTTTKNRDQYESMLNDLWRLCLHLHNDALEGKFFMDNPHLINAINENEADSVSNIINRFFVTALTQMLKDCSGLEQYFRRSDMRYVVGSCSQFVTTINKDRHEFLKDKNVPLSVGLYEKTTTTLLLMMLSCISYNSYKCISFSLLQLRIRDIGQSDNGSDSYVWSWLFCLTTCVLSTAAHVYEMYATDLEMKHPLCHFLLLDHSIEHFCLHFLTIGPSVNHILKFTKYVQESVQTGLLGGILTRDNLTLKFFFENKTLSDVITKHFSPHQVIGLEKGKGSAQLPPSDGCAAGKACRAHHGANIADSSHRCLQCGQKIHSALLCGMSISQIVTKYPHLRGHKLRSSRNDRRIVEDDNDEDMNGVCFTCIEKMTVGTNSGGGVMFADKDDGIHKSVHTETGAPSATVANLSSSVYNRTKRSTKDECMASYCEDDADDKDASTSVSSSYPTQSDNTHDAATASSVGRSETNLTKQAVAYVVPSVTEEKYQQLRHQLQKMMRQLKPYGIFRVLEESQPSKKDKQSSYNKKCVDFCKKKFGDVGTTYYNYLTKMVAYSGLLIHDIVSVGHRKNLNDHQKVFVHVLCYCIGSNNPNEPDFWKIFFAKLMPRSAVDSSNAGHKIWLYFRKWYDKMEIPPPSEEQLEFLLEYYHRLNYLSDASRKVRKIKNIETKKDGSSQVKKSLGKATTTNGKNPSPPKEKTTRREVVVKQTSKMISSERKAGSLADKRQTTEENQTPQKKCRAMVDCSSTGEQKSNDKPSRPAGYKNLSENTSFASSNRKSSRMSSPTKFFCPK